MNEYDARLISEAGFNIKAASDSFELLFNQVIAPRLDEVLARFTEQVDRLSRMDGREF